MKISLQSSFIGVLLALIFVSCSKDSDNIPDEVAPDYLFKANFIRDWLPPESSEAIIFVSDDMGNVLAEQIWSGNDSVELKPFVDSLEFPPTINVTTVYYTPYNNRFNITTNMRVPVSSSWTFKGTKSAQIHNQKTVDFIFQNTPSHRDYLMSSMWMSRSSSSSMSQPFSFNFYESPADILLKLNTVDHGYQYRWFRNVVEGTVHADLSLSNFKASHLHTIKFNSNSSGLRMSLNAYPNPGQHSGGTYRVDALFDYSNTYQEVVLSYPGDDFTDYRTLISFVDDFSGNSYWTQISFGDLPTEFAKINADFDIISPSINNFELSAIGDFIQIKSVWADDKENKWTIYGDKSLLNYKLPVMSQSVIERFNINRTQFKLISAELIDYPEVQLYDEVRDIQFNSLDYFFDVLSMSRSRTKLNVNSDIK